MTFFFKIVRFMGFFVSCFLFFVFVFVVLFFVLFCVFFFFFFLVFSFLQKISNFLSQTCLYVFFMFNYSFMTFFSHLTVENWMFLKFHGQKQILPFFSRSLPFWYIWCHFDVKWKWLVLIWLILIEWTKPQNMLGRMGWSFSFHKKCNFNEYVISVNFL